jgi:hypothetical protein
MRSYCGGTDVLETGVRIQESEYRRENTEYRIQEVNRVRILR